MRIQRLAVWILLALALCAWCGWASAFHRSTTPAITTWVCSLAIVVTISRLFWRGRRGRRFSVRLPASGKSWPRAGRNGGGRTLLGLSPWLLLILIVAVWEVLSIDTGPSEPHLTISALAQAFRPMAAALLFVWMLVGLGYAAARARAPIGWEPGTSVRSGSGETSAASAGMIAQHPSLTPALLLPPSRAAGVAFWVGLVVACVLVDLAAKRSQGRIASAEEFVRLISRPRAANVLLVGAWVFAGWHLFAR